LNFSQSTDDTDTVVNIVEEGRFGGPQKRILDVAKDLKEDHNIETFVIFSNYDSKRFESLLAKSQIPHLAIGLHRLTKDPWHLLMYVLLFPWELFSIFRLLRKIKPIAVHCNGSFQIKGAIAAKLAGIKCVWHMNDTYAPKPLYKLFKFLSRWFGDQFIAASHRTAEYYFPNSDDSIPVIQAPIDTSVFDPQSVEPDQKIADLPGIKVVAVGNINPVKGLTTFIEAANLINRQSDLNIEFVAVGKLLENQSKYIAGLKNQIKSNEVSNFHFWGASDRVKEILRATDIYCCCSDFEASPISVWEAMSMGLPIVATDVGDVKSYVENHECGLVVEPTEPQQLADAIISAAQSGDLQRWGENSRKTAIEHFDKSICVKGHADIYRAVSAKSQ